MLTGFSLLDDVLIVTQSLQVFTPAEMSSASRILRAVSSARAGGGEGKGKKDKKNKSDEEAGKKEEDDESTSLWVCLTTFGMDNSTSPRTFSLKGEGPHSPSPQRERAPVRKGFTEARC